MLISRQTRRKSYMVGRGMVWTNLAEPGIRYASSKSVGRMTGNSLSRIESTIKQEMDKGLSKPEVRLPEGQGADVVQAIRKDLRKIVNKGQFIPNHSEIMEEVVKYAPVQDVQPKNQRGKSVGNKSLSELLAKTRKGKGIVLHGQQGAGFAYA